MHTLGGATKALAELAVSLKKRGVEVVVCTSVRDQFNEFLDKNGIENLADGHFSVMDEAPPKSIKRPLQYIKRTLKYRLKRKRAIKIIEQQVDLKSIDIIHTNSARNDIGCMLHQKYGIPHVMHVREFGVEDFSCWTFRRGYYNYLNKHCDIILAVSEAVRKSWISKGISANLIHTLYDGVDFDGFIIKDSDSYSSKTLRLVFVGGICETKGQHLAVCALGKLSAEARKNITLDLIGWYDSVYLEKVKHLIADSGLEKNITFCGSRDDVAQLLHNYDVGLMCSKSEGFGRVTAEYMYAGLGVIAANTGASPELIDNEITGLVYSRDEVEDLAENIMRFYSDRELLHRCGQNAHDVAKSRFTVNRNMSEVLQVYKISCKQENI